MAVHIRSSIVMGGSRTRSPVTWKTAFVTAALMNYPMDARYHGSPAPTHLHEGPCLFANFG
ncbi:hypothetical protein BZM26_37095 [Paraburkholderia strydomiana]|nr:hypothetical protein BZM26_37095 [Paraburkholderia strydomiana]